MNELGRFFAFIAVIVFVPIALLLFWLILRIWPKEHSTTSWFLVSMFDVFFVILNAFAVCAWLGFGGAIWSFFTAKFGNLPNSYPYDQMWFYPWRVSLFFLVVACLVFGANKTIYALPRQRRILTHFLVSLFLIFTILSLNEPTIAGPICRWFVNPNALFFHADDPKRGSGRWSDYYGFDQEAKNYYHFEEELLGRNRDYHQEFDFYEHYSKRTIISTNIVDVASDAAKYLVLHDLSNYQLITQEQKNPLISKAVYTTPGFYVNLNPGLLRDVHFANDHSDTSYASVYRDRPDKVAVKIEVTQHSNSDSDQWLSHELECVMKGRFEGTRICDRRKLDTCNGD